jgi:hypothetical protein
MDFDKNINLELDYKFFQYPVWYQQQNGYLVLACPDLNIAVSTDLPTKKKVDVEYGMKLFKAMMKMEVKIRERVLALKSSNMKLPSPSKTKKVLTDTKIKKLTAPTVAKMIGKSADTIRRMADRGELPCSKTPGGTRYFLEKDILDFI